MYTSEDFDDTKAMVKDTRRKCTGRNTMSADSNKIGISNILDIIDILILKIEDIDNKLKEK